MGRLKHLILHSLKWPNQNSKEKNPQIQRQSEICMSLAHTIHSASSHVLRVSPAYRASVSTLGERVLLGFFLSEAFTLQAMETPDSDTAMKTHRSKGKLTHTQTKVEEQRQKDVCQLEAHVGLYNVVLP